MARMHGTYVKEISMFARLTKLSATALAALAVTLATTATAGTAAPKPGFMPGVWVGSGTIKGSINDGGMYTMFNGRVSFTLKVSKSLGVSGTGTWKVDMLGAQVDAPSSYGVDATIVGTASIVLKGTSTNVTYSGKQKLMTQIRAGSRKTTLKESEADLFGRLAISRAYTCKVVGSTVIQPGVTLTWSARLKGSC